ncbi:hypothetical protein HDU98_003196 [Podochytrium sp. JEL0797]|nr:hypothetical protein HDU98_003196 [Podochytrium sp. JEL0797]
MAGCTFRFIKQRRTDAALGDAEKSSDSPATSPVIMATTKDHDKELQESTISVASLQTSKEAAIVIPNTITEPVEPESPPQRMEEGKPPLAPISIDVSSKQRTKSVSGSTGGRVRFLKAGEEVDAGPSVPVEAAVAARRVSSHRRKQPKKPAMKRSTGSIGLEDTDTTSGSAYSPSVNGSVHGGSVHGGSMYSYASSANFSTKSKTKSFRHQYQQQFVQYQQMQRDQFLQQHPAGAHGYLVAGQHAAMPSHQSHQPQYYPQQMSHEQMQEHQKQAYRVYKEQKLAMQKQQQPMDQEYVNAWWRAYFQHNPQAAYAQYYAMTGMNPYAPAPSTAGSVATFGSVDPGAAAEMAGSKTVDGLKGVKGVPK